MVLVELDDLTPVRGDFGEMETLAEVDEIEDVLLEAGAAESDGCLEELGAYARVVADGVGDFVDVGAGGLADGREGVDGGYALGEHGVCGELGELRGPEADIEDAFFGDPVCVDLCECVAGVAAFLGLERANEDAVGAVEIVDGGALGEEFGVGEDVEAAVRL